MPYHVVKTGQCPQSRPWAVVNTQTGEVVPGGCHKTQDEADAHMAALYANVDDARD